MKKEHIVLLIVLLLVAGIVGVLTINKGQKDTTVGSIIESQGYKATSTPFDTAIADAQIKIGSGSLGSVVITSTGDQKFNLYDATSTVATNRPSKRSATSSALIGSFTTATAGTFQLDAYFHDGLLLDVVSGDNGTTTLTYR